MQKKSEKIILTLYLLGFLALALTIALLQPLANTPPLFGNPPDEHARYLIPQFICRYVHGTPGECDFRTVDGSCCILYWEESISG